MRKSRIAVGLGVLALLVLVAIWKLRGGGESERARARDVGGSAAHGAATSALETSKGPRAPAAPATLSGRVTRKADGTGVEGAVVTLGRTQLETMFGSNQEPTLTVTTGAQGAWTATGVAPGRYAISATAKGLVPASLDKVVVVEGGATTGLDLALATGGATVSGTVSDVGGGPVSGARIAVQRDKATPFGSTELTTFAGPDGRYELTLADGDYTASVSHDDYTPVGRGFALAGQPVELDFVLAPGGAIRGVVVTQEGTPVPGALVLAEGKRGPDGTARTDDHGAFALHSLGSGATTLRAAGRGYASEQPTIVELGIGEQVEGVRVVVDRAFSISGTVVDAGSKRGIPGVRLGAFSIAGGQLAVAPDPTDADGTFEIVGVRAASYMLFAIGETTMPEIGKAVEVVNKDVTGIVVEMGVGVTVTGRVEPGTVAEIGLAPTQVGIGNIFEAVKAMLVTAESDATGAFVLNHVPPGSFTLRARVSDGRAGSIPLVVGTTDKTGVVVKLEPRAAIAGRVVDSNNVPVPRIQVSARSKTPQNEGINFRSNGEEKAALTAPDGSFRIVGLDADTFLLAVSDDQGEIPCTKCAAFEVTLRPAETRTGVLLTVEARDGVIAGQVTDKEGRPVPDAWVTAEIDEGGPRFERYRQMMAERSGKPPTLTGADGRFTFRNLRRGEYSLTAETAKGTARATAEHVKLGASVTLVLAPLGTLTGKVTVAGAPATTFALDCGLASGQRQFNSPAGTYELERIPPVS